MHKTRTAFIDVNHPRKKTALQVIREAVETRTNSRPPSSVLINSSLEYCLDTLPAGPVLRINLDDILDSFGNLVGEVDSGEVVLYGSFNPSPVLLALAARISGTLFELPTDAGRIVDVWFDSLHADPETMWQFELDTTITTTESLEANILVQVLYVGINNS